MEAVELIEVSIAFCRINTGAPRVALCVDEAGWYWCPDGVERYLPVLVPDGRPGYVEFVPEIRGVVAVYFGDNLEEAERKVDEINARNGIGREEMLRIVGLSMELQNRG